MFLKSFYLKIKISLRESFILRKDLLENKIQKRKSGLITLLISFKNKFIEIFKKIYFKIKKCFIFLIEKTKYSKKQEKETGKKEKSSGEAANKTSKN